MDGIQFQRFTQITRDRWKLEVTSKQGRSFLVEHFVQPFGYIREVLTESGKLIWDRDFKAGEMLKMTWELHITQTGKTE